MAHNIPIMKSLILWMLDVTLRSCSLCPSYTLRKFVPVQTVIEDNVAEAWQARRKVFFLFFFFLLLGRGILRQF